MSPSFLTLDLMPLTAALLASVSCGLLGSILVLRRESLLGDAISHSVLPGIVVAFLVGASGLLSGGGAGAELAGHDARNPLLMLVGAAIAGVLSVAVIELVKRVGKVESGAAMGVVFSVFFAAGVFFMQQAAKNVDLDASCVLYGDLEGLFWDHRGAPLSGAALGAVPRQVYTLLAVLVLGVAFVGVFFKEIRIASFDPELATSLGFRAGWLSVSLLVLVALATVAAFEAVGSILVIAMLICPGATARLLTDRLRTHLLLSAGLGAASAVIGYFGGTHLAPALGLGGALNAAGSISLAGGLLFAGAALASPRHGVVARLVHRRSLARRVALEDLLGSLYRLREGGAEWVQIADIERSAGDRLSSRGLLALAERSDLVLRNEESVGLTERGAAIARELVRRHRLWESYLVDRAGLSPDHVHDPAEQLEHVLGIDHPDLADRTVDPHGREIPESDTGRRTS